MKSARVLLLIDSFLLGGAERQAVLLARELHRRFSVTVEVWALRGGGEGPTSDLCRAAGIGFRALGFVWRPRSRLVFAWLHALTAFLRFRPDFIVSYSPSTHRVCALLWRFTTARAHIWNQRDEGRDKPDGLIRQLRRAARLTPRFIANSPGGASFLTDRLAVSERRIRVVRNGVFLPPGRSSRDQWRRRIGLSAGCFVVGMAARLGSQKDHATLLRAWRRVLDSRSPSADRFILLLAGREEPGWSLPRELCGRLSLSPSVHFLGHVEDIGGLLSALDLFVLSSVSEGMPNAVLEAMAAGLPVVASDIPGIRSILPPSGHRFLFDPGDEAGLAGNILRIAQSPETAARLGRENREHAELNFGAGEMAAATFEHMCRGAGLPFADGIAPRFGP